MTHEVFISYSSKDKAIADAVCATLEAASIPCWIAPRNILPGATWGEAIIDGLSTSRVMVLIFSANSNQSVQVVREVERAINKNIPVIPFRIDNVPLSKAMEYFISSAHWLVAVPLTKRYLQQLVGDVSRLLDKTPPALPPLTFLERLKVLRHQGIALLTRRVMPPGRPAAASTEPSSRPASNDNTQPLDSEVLVSQRRWHGIKVLIGEREAQGIPLRQLARLKPELAKRLEAFERARVRAIAAIEHLGPDVVDERLRILAEIVSDHPDLEAIRSRAVDMQTKIADLRRKLDEFERQDRWVAAENAIRTVAAQRGLATASLLRAAATASVKAGRETRRLSLLLWALLVGFALIAAVWVMQASVGLTGAIEFSNLDSNSVAPESRASLQVVIVRLIAITAVTGIGLGFFGKRQSATGMAFMVMWALVGLTAQILATVLKANGPVVPEAVMTLLPDLEGVVSAIVMMNLIRLTTSEVVSPRPGFPGFAAILTTIAASGGFLSESSGLGLKTAWFRMLPESLIAAGLLAVSGFLGSLWPAFPIVALVVGGLGASTGENFAMSQSGASFLGTVGMLFLVGSLVSGRRSLLGYVWILAVAVLAYGVARVSEDLDAGLMRVPLARFSPLLSVWAVACGVVALGKKQELGELRAFDCLRKILATRVAYVGTRFADQRLTDTAWYKAGRSWHERRTRVNDGSEPTADSKLGPQRSAGPKSPPKD